MTTLVLIHPCPLASLAGALESAVVLESWATLFHQLRKMTDPPDELLKGEEGEFSQWFVFVTWAQCSSLLCVMLCRKPMCTFGAVVVFVFLKWPEVRGPSAARCRSIVYLHNYLFTHFASMQPFTFSVTFAGTT